MADEPASEFDQALGAELRAIRERKGWTRLQAVEALRAATGVEIGDRTLLTYEHGIRHIAAARLVELAAAYSVPATLIMSDALQRMGVDPTCPTCGRRP